MLVSEIRDQQGPRRTRRRLFDFIKLRGRDEEKPSISPSRCPHSLRQFAFSREAGFIKRKTPPFPLPPFSVVLGGRDLGRGGGETIRKRDATVGHKSARSCRCGAVLILLGVCWFSTVVITADVEAVHGSKQSISISREDSKTTSTRCPLQ